MENISVPIKAFEGGSDLFSEVGHLWFKKINSPSPLWAFLIIVNG